MTGSRLSSLLKERSDYLVWIGVPLADPDHWVTATVVNASSVETSDGQELSLHDVTHFVVTYPNSQVVASEMTQLELPQGVTELALAEDPETDFLTLEMLEAGQAASESPMAPAPGNRMIPIITQHL